MIGIAYGVFALISVILMTANFVIGGLEIPTFIMTVITFGLSFLDDVPEWHNWVWGFNTIIWLILIFN